MKQGFHLAPDWNDPVIAAYEKDVDVTLLRANLRLTVEERLIKFERTRDLYEELRKAGDELRSRKATQGN